MANIFYNVKFNRALLSCTLASFTLGIIPQVHAYPLDYQCAVNLNDIVFGIRLEKLIDKINRAKDKMDSKKLLEYMVELKQEVEGYTGQKIDIDKKLDEVEKEMRNRGAKYSHSEMKKVRKTIKDKDKRAHHKAMFMGDCIASGIEFDVELENFTYLTKQGKDKDNGKEETAEFPLSVTIGITAALCGLFITIIPIPICKKWGPELLFWGAGLAVEGTIFRKDDEQKDKK